MGGYVCFPGGLVAKLMGRPLMLVNADAALLLSNKGLLPVADRVAFGFAGDAAAKTKNAVVTGNPVRQEILDVSVPGLRFAGRAGVLRILVVGGSLGAKALNDALPAALALIPEAQRPLVTHQSGKKNIDALRRAEDDLPSRSAMFRRLVERADGAGRVGSFRAEFDGRHLAAPWLTIEPQNGCRAELLRGGGKPVPVGPVARLPKGVASWEALAALGPEGPNEVLAEPGQGAGLVEVRVERGAVEGQLRQRDLAQHAVALLGGERCVPVPHAVRLCGAAQRMAPASWRWCTIRPISPPSPRAR